MPPKIAPETAKNTLKTAANGVAEAMPTYRKPRQNRLRNLRQKRRKPPKTAPEAAIAENCRDSRAKSGIGNYSVVNPPKTAPEAAPKNNRRKWRQSVELHQKCTTVEYCRCCAKTRRKMHQKRRRKPPKTAPETVEKVTKIMRQLKTAARAASKQLSSTPILALCAC